LLDIGSLGPNEEEHFFWIPWSLAHGDDRFCKFIENSITIAVLDQCRRDLRIDLKIARRIRKPGIVLEPDPHFAEVPIDNVLLIVLSFIISWVPMESFTVGYWLILVDEFLRKYTHIACREEITSLAIGLLDDRGQS
jgi:hypothetical protein